MLEFHTEITFACFLWDTGRCGGKLKTDAKSNFENEHEKSEHPPWFKKNNWKYTKYDKFCNI